MKRLLHIIMIVVTVILVSRQQAAALTSAAPFLNSTPTNTPTRTATIRVGAPGGVRNVSLRSPRVAPRFQNGSFEVDASGSTSLTNWTIVGGNTSGIANKVDLGVTSLGGCVSQDTTDYVNVAVTSYPLKAGSSAPTDDHSFNPTQYGASSYSTTAAVANSVPSAVGLDGSTSLGATILAGNNVLKLTNSETNGSNYRVIHGPSVVSDLFYAESGEVITLDWYAQYIRDNFAILGYLLDTSTCTQYEIVDASAKVVAGWQSASVAIPATSSNYRFVFTNGTYDQSGGTASGATMYIDNITVGLPQVITFALPATANRTDPPITLGATAGSGLPVEYLSLTTTICTVSGTTLTIVAAGTCTIQAGQAGGDNGGSTYAAAPYVTRSLTITSYTATPTPTNTRTSTATSTATATATYTATATSTRTSTPTRTATSTVVPGTIPTTSNPTINNALGGVRIVANPSFEQGTKTAFPCEPYGGWYTSHPPQGSCRPFELWGSGLTNVESLSGVTPPDGSYYIELNAYSVSMAFQPICMVGGETFDFEFYHHTRSWSSTNQIQFRFGIPSGLPSGSRAADSYSRVVLTGNNVLGGAGSTAVASETAGTDTINVGHEVKGSPNTNWVRFYGTHTIPGDFGGLRNLGFYGVLPAGSASANLIDDINIDLNPLMDLGTSRDASAAEGSSPTSLNIRINGKVFAGTTIVLNKLSGTAVSDTDFTLGTVTAGINGTATVRHTAGSNAWEIDVPAGYYDGGMVPSNNQGGLTIPITYATDLTTESTEWAWFAIGDPNVDNATDNWSKSDPTCDGSEKNDGVVYSITNVAVPQTITFPAVADMTAGGTATLAATSDSGLAVSYTSTTPSICTVSGTIVTAVAAGNCLIKASQAGGTDGSGTTYAAATDVTNTIKVKAAQTITFAAPPTKNKTDANFAPGATASSGLTVSYTSSTPLVCTIVSGLIHLVDAGTCTVTADQAGNTSYGAAPSVTQSFIVKNTQVITFPTIPDQNQGGPTVALAATASSSLAVTYTSTTPSICTVSGSTVTLVTAGNCSIKASQAGDSAYSAAADVTNTFKIKPAQTITYVAPADRVKTSADFDPAATASSSLAVTYTSITPLVCTIVANKIHLVGPGTCTTTASQPGDTNYAPAPDVTRSFVVKDTQVITFPTIADQNEGGPTVTLAATASSGLAVTYTSTTPSICTVSGSTVTLVTAGNCSIKASQAGDSAYAAAADVTNTFKIKPAQTITYVAPADRAKTSPDFDPAATSSASLFVTYTSSTPTVCTIVLNKIHIVGPGTCTTTASQPGDTNYAPAPDMTRSFVVKDTQVITFPTIADVGTDAASFSVAATASSALPVMYTSMTPAVCMISNGTVTVLGAGDCSIKASQPGNATFSAATDVTRTFKIKAPQTITFAPLVDLPYTDPDFDPAAIASSTLPVTYTTSTPSVCTIISNKVHLVAPGTCTVTANQIGGVSGGVPYNAAPPVSQSFIAKTVPQGIAFPAIPNKNAYDGSFLLNATSSSGLPVTYTSSSPAFCTVSGSRVIIVKGGGFCTIVAHQGGGTVGGNTFGPADDVTREFVISDATRTPTASKTRTVTPTAELSDLRKAAIGNLFVVALLRDGTIAAWGSNKPNIHESIIPPQFQNTVFKDIAASIGNAYVLDEAGNLSTWGENLYGEGNIPGDAQTGVKAVAAGARFAFAIRSDDTVAAWGRNEFGQVDVPAGLGDVIAVDGGDRHAVALKRDGTVVAWGDNTARQTSVPPGLSGVIAISAGQDHTMALLNTGMVVAWGSNAKGQTKVPLDVSDIVAIAAGRECSFAVKADGKLYAWGNSTYTKFPASMSGRSVVVVDSANQNSIVGLRGGSILVAGVSLSDVKASRTLTTTPIITLTPSETPTPSETLTLTVSKTPSMTRSLTSTRTYTFTRTSSLTKTATRTMTPSRTKSPTRTR